MIVQALATIDSSPLKRHGDYLPFAFSDELGRDVHAILLLFHGELLAFENRCPHWNTPLDLHAPSLFDSSSNSLICQTHGARFDPESGLCLSGPCLGDHITLLALHPSDTPHHVIITRPGLSLPT